MAKRKFTPPTEFPAEYVDSNGDKAVILGRGPHGVFPFIGHSADGGAASWTATGIFHTEGTSRYDLHDISERITTWHNVYEEWVGAGGRRRRRADLAATESRLCVYRIERDEDGGNPEIFVEEV